MKKASPALILVALVFPAVARPGVPRPSVPQAVTVLGFRQAAALALRENPRLQESREKSREARAALEMQRGRLLPHLALLWQAQRSNDPLAVLGEELGERRASFADLGLGDYTGPANLVAVPPALNQPPYVNEFTTALLLTVPVWSWGARRESLAAARARSRAGRDLLRSERSAVVLLLLRRYEGVLAARALLRAARADRRAAKTVLAVTRERLRRGLALPSDLLRARAAAAASRLLVQRMRSGLATALADFRIALGVSPDRPVIPAPAPLAVRRPGVTFATLEIRALGANPRLAALRESTVARRHLLAAARAARWPRLDLSIEHAWNASTPGFRAPSNTFLATVRWPLFTFGESRGAVSVARARWRASRAALLEARRELRVRLGRLWRGVVLARERLRVARLAQQADLAARHATLLRYRRGLSTLGAVLRAQARVERAQARLVEARYGLLMSLAALRFAAGRLSSRDILTLRTIR